MVWKVNLGLLGLLDTCSLLEELHGCFSALFISIGFFQLMLEEGSRGSG